MSQGRTPGESEPARPVGLASQVPATGVRYVLTRTREEPEQVTYQGFAHLPEADLQLTAQVALPGGAVQAAVTPPDHPRAAEIAKSAAALVRAATKAEVTANRALPRKIARWRA